MKRRTGLFAIVLLLCGYGAVAWWRLSEAQASRAHAEAGRTVLRWAQYSMDSATMDALEEIVRRYEARNPGVLVRLQFIPERVWPMWARAALVGGDPPDLMQVGRGLEVATRPALFRPLTRWVDQPNPYNAGTHLDDVSWRSTFRDGMSGFQTLIPSLGEIYTAPTSLVTVRVFYNKALFRAALGHDRPPGTYAEFVEYCRALERHFGPAGGFAPIAGSKGNSPQIYHDLSASQTQLLGWRLNPDRHLLTGDSQVALAFFEGKWDWSHPAIHSALRLIREISAFETPGSLSLRDEDALFRFSQGRAAMITWESGLYTQLRVLAPFEIGAFRFPVPEHDDPEYGRHVFGRASETSPWLRGVFAVTSESRQPERAVDFLHYLTSVEAAEIYARVARQIPAVRVDDLPDDLTPLLPRPEGFVEGFRLHLPGVPEMESLYNREWFSIFGPTGGPDVFIDRYAPFFRPAARTGLETLNRRQVEALRRMEPSLAVTALEGTGDVEPKEAWSAHSRQSLAEFEQMYFREKLDRLE